MAFVVKGVRELLCYQGIVSGFGDSLDGCVEDLGQFLPDLFNEALTDIDAVFLLFDEEACSCAG